MDFTALLQNFCLKLDSKGGCVPRAFLFTAVVIVITTRQTIAGPEVHVAARVRSIAWKVNPEKRAWIVKRRFQAENISQNLPHYVNDFMPKPWEERTTVQYPLSDLVHHSFNERCPAGSPRCTGSSGSESSIEVSKC